MTRLFPSRSNLYPGVLVVLGLLVSILAAGSAYGQERLTVLVSNVGQRLSLLSTTLHTHDYA